MFKVQNTITSLMIQHEKIMEHSNTHMPKNEVVEYKWKANLQNIKYTDVILLVDSPTLYCAIRTIKKLIFFSFLGGTP